MKHMDLAISVEGDRVLSEASVGALGGKRPEHSFGSWVGSHEFFSHEMWRATLTELVATSCLIFTLTIAIISCLDAHQADPKLLLPFAVFVVLFLFLFVTVPLSGGHMSPVFTLAAALGGLVTPIRAFCYIVAQCIGSTVSFFILKQVMDPNATNRYLLGGCATSGLNLGTALSLEFCCTFIVLFLGLTVAFDPRRSKELGLTIVCVVVAGAVAVAVFVSVMVTGRAGYSGVGLNPSRCLGAALMEGGSLWDGHWVFWVGPFFACLVYRWFYLNLPRNGLVLVDEGV